MEGFLIFSIQIVSPRHIIVSLALEVPAPRHHNRVLVRYATRKLSTMFQRKCLFIWRYQKSQGVKLLFCPFQGRFFYRGFPKHMYPFSSNHPIVFSWWNTLYFLALKCWKSGDLVERWLLNVSNHWIFGRQAKNVKISLSALLAKKD